MLKYVQNTCYEQPLDFFFFVSEKEKKFLHLEPTQDLWYLLLTNLLHEAKHSGTEKHLNKLDRLKKFLK